MKKVIALFLSLVIMLSVFAVAPITSSAAEVDSAQTGGVCGMFNYTVLEDGTAEITSYYGNDVVINIPSEVDGYTVTSIGEQAFMYSYLSEVNFPETLINIKTEAFYGCVYLEKIHIPASVLGIGYQAFRDCYNVKSITVDENNVVYDSRDNCNAIILTKTNEILVGCDNTVIPKNINEISYAAFSKCYGLTDITISSGHLSQEAFYGCTNLKNVTLGSSVERVCEDTFKNCSNLETITFYGMNTEVYMYDAETVIPANTTIVALEGSNAHQYAQKYNRKFEPLEVHTAESNGIYEYIILEDNTAEIIGFTPPYITVDGYPSEYPGGTYFEDDYTLPSELGGYIVTSIGDGVFSHQDCFSTVTIPDTITRIGTSAFEYCTMKGVTLGNSVEYIGSHAFSCSNIEHITLPDSLEYIADYAIFSCDFLQEISIPDSVRFVDSDIFASCTNLKKVKLSESLKHVSNHMFFGCVSLEKITFPDSIVHIGMQSFAYCESIKSIDIHNNIKEIDGYAFMATGLTEVYIPASVERIGDINYGDNPFEFCNDLTKIVVDPENKYFDSRNNCNAIIRTIDDTLISGCQNTVIPEDTKIVDYESFRGLSTLVEIEIPESVEEIGERAFELCDNLEKVVIYNRDCEIYDTYSNLGDYSITTIYGYVDSTAQTYAEKYGYNFVPLEEKPEIVRPEKVENFHAEEVTHNSFTVAWDPVEGATSYTVINMVNGYNYKTTKETSLVIPDRNVGTTYKFAVIANFDDGTKMDVSKADVLELRVDAKVKNLRADNVTNDSITISWDEIEGAEYIIYIGENKFDRTSDTTFVIANRKSYTKHDIRVVAFFPGAPENKQFQLNDATVLSVTTDKLDKYTTQSYLDVPIIDEVKDADWNSDRGAYNLWLLFGDSADNLNKTYRIYSMDDTYPLQELEYNKDYYFAYRYSKDGKYETTEPQKITTQSPPQSEFGDMDVIDVTYTTEGKAVLNWVSVDNPVEYKLYKNGKFFTNITVNEDSEITAYTLDSFEDGDKVYVRANCEYRPNRFRMFYYKEVTLKK